MLHSCKNVENRSKYRNMFMVTVTDITPNIILCVFDGFRLETSLCCNWVLLCCYLPTVWMHCLRVVLSNEWVSQMWLCLFFANVYTVEVERAFSSFTCHLHVEHQSTNSLFILVPTLTNCSVIKRKIRSVHEEKKIDERKSFFLAKVPNFRLQTKLLYSPFSPCFRFYPQTFFVSLLITEAVCRLPVT